MNWKPSFFHYKLESFASYTWITNSSASPLLAQTSRLNKEIQVPKQADLIKKFKYQKVHILKLSKKSWHLESPIENNTLYNKFEYEAAGSWELLQKPQKQ